MEGKIPLPLRKMDLVKTLKIHFAMLPQGKIINSYSVFIDKISDHNCYRMLNLHGRETSLHICVCLDGKHLKYHPQNTSLGCTLKYIFLMLIDLTLCFFRCGQVSLTFLDSYWVPFNLGLPSAGPYVSREHTMLIWKGLNLVWSSLPSYAFFSSPDLLLPSLEMKEFLTYYYRIILSNCLFHRDIFKHFAILYYYFFFL